MAWPLVSEAPAQLLTLADDVIEYPFRNASIDGRDATLWVKLRYGGKAASLPLFPLKQTFANAIGTSVEGQ